MSLETSVLGQHPCKSLNHYPISLSGVGSRATFFWFLEMTFLLLPISILTPWFYDDNTQHLHASTSLSRLVDHTNSHLYSSTFSPRYKSYVSFLDDYIALQFFEFRFFEKRNSEVVTSLTATRSFPRPIITFQLPLLRISNPMVLLKPRSARPFSHSFSLLLP